jgi:hypothetical protein
LFLDLLQPPSTLSIPRNGELHKESGEIGDPNRKFAQILANGAREGGEGTLNHESTRIFRCAGRVEVAVGFGANYAVFRRANPGK